eukprot:jgi/Phyca11/15643/fgenesh1_pg.PHYCAscaffold_14_\
MSDSPNAGDSPAPGGPPISPTVTNAAVAYNDLQREFEDLQREHALLRREITTLRAELTSTLQQAAPYVSFCQRRYDLLRHRLEETQLRLAEMESALAVRRDNSVEIACIRDRLLAFEHMHADVVAEYNERVDELEARLASTRPAISTSQLAQAIFDQDVAAAERDAAIADRNCAIAARDVAVAERDSTVADRDTVIADRDSAVAARDVAVAERDSVIADRDSAVAACAQADAQRTRIASLEGQVGSSQQHESSPVSPFTEAFAIFVSQEESAIVIWNSSAQTSTSKSSSNTKLVGPSSGRCWHHGLITEANIRALYAANPPPWDALRRIVVPRSFEMSGWFADFCQRYEDFEEASRQVFWETTHKLPITPAMCAAEPFLEQYRNDCRVRRMRAGPRWKRLLKHLMAGLKSSECDLDLLLDPYFLHFPARGEQVCWYPGQGERQCPADLLAALEIVDRADPWRNQHRANIADHPGSRLARLDRKFFQADDSD